MEHSVFTQHFREHSGNVLKLAQLYVVIRFFTVIGWITQGGHWDFQPNRHGGFSQNKLQNRQQSKSEDKNRIEQGFSVRQLKTLTVPTLDAQIVFLENAPWRSGRSFGSVFGGSQANIGKYRACTVAIWLREHPICDVGHQWIALCSICFGICCAS
jgi:hypothetical protein